MGLSPCNTGKIHFHLLSLLWPFCFHPRRRVYLLFSANEPTELRLRVRGQTAAVGSPEMVLTQSNRSFNCLKGTVFSRLACSTVGSAQCP